MDDPFNFRQSSENFSPMNINETLKEKKKVFHNSVNVNRLHLKFSSTGMLYSEHLIFFSSEAIKSSSTDKYRIEEEGNEGEAQDERRKDEAWM